MQHPWLVALGAVVLFAQDAGAVEVTGSTVDLSYSTFFDDTDVSRFALGGQVEVGFTRNFSLQFDAAYYDLNAVNDSGRTLGVHAIYHFSEEGSLGAFWGNDDISGSDVDFYGLEGGYEFNSVDAEVYFATCDTAGVDGTIIGADPYGEIGNGFGLGAGIDHGNFDGGVDVTRFNVMVDYAATRNTSVYLEIGSLDVNAFGLSGSEGFIGFGARFDFGAERGATFGRRGLLELLPGL